METMDSALSIYVPEKYYFTVAGLVFVPLVMLVTDLVTDTHLSLIKVTLRENLAKVKTRKRIQYHEWSSLSIKK